MSIEYVFNKQKNVKENEKKITTNGWRQHFKIGTYFNRIIVASKEFMK